MSVRDEGSVKETTDWTAQEKSTDDAPDEESIRDARRHSIGAGDVAAAFIASLDPAVANKPIEPAEARKVLWKIDLIILPMLAITVIIGAVDKVSISNAAIYGMTEDTHLKPNQYSWLGSILYFGYLLFELPAAWIIQRFPVGKFMAGTVCGWGILMMCTAATKDFAGLVTIRFIMGMLEAVVFPVSAIFTVMWWKRQEQPLRLACWQNQFSSIVNGIMSYGVGHAHTSLAPWRLIFLAMGAVSFAWGIFLFFFLPDSPTTCWYFSERERFICVQRVKTNDTGVEDKTTKWYQVRECVQDPKTWLLAIFACAQNICNGGLVTFAAIIVKGLGYSNFKTILLGMPTGVIATGWQFLLAFFCARVPNSRCATIAFGNIFPIICAVLMWKLPREHKTALLGSYYAFYSYWAPYTLSNSLPMANVSGHSKKVTMNGIFFLSYCIGNIIGPQVFRANDAPNYSRGYQGLLATIAVATAAIIGYAALCILENRRRDAAQRNAPRASVDITAFSDRTDKEKPSFRYSY
ncbi:hypothetical protein DV735_g3013, partial [Chaetothyriales sp. CBS 134920]